MSTPPPDASSGVPASAAVKRAPAAEPLAEAHPDSGKTGRIPDPLAAVVFDFDGVLTDNRVIVFEDGTEAVVCDRSDGWGISALRRQGVPLLVISTEKNPVVSARCQKLQIPCLQGVDGKLSALRRWARETGIDLRQVIYVGNDVNDLECLAAVGCGVAVQDARPEVLAVAHLVLAAPGGRGAVRELADLIQRELASRVVRQAPRGETPRP